MFKFSFITKQFLIPIVIYVGIASLLYFVSNTFLKPAIFYDLQHIGSNILATVILIHVFGIIVFKHKRLIYEWNNFIAEPVSPYSLAVFRIGFFGLINGLYWYQFQNAGILKLGEPTVVALPYTSWYLNLLPFNYQFYKTIYLAGIVVASLSALGIGYRYIAWLNILFSFYLIGLPMFLGKLFFMQLWFWGSCILAFAPAADVLSFDSLFSRQQGIYQSPKPHYKYGIALKWIWLHLGIIYFFSAIWKLKDTGLYWALGDNMINQMQIEWLTNYYRIPTFRLDQYPLLAHSGGLFIIIIELIFIFLLFQKPLRWLALLGGITIHWGATYFLHLSMGDLQFMYLSLLCVMLVPVKANNKVFTIGNYKTNTITMWIGAFLFTLNSVFGFFNIASWPISSYPTHSANIQSTFARIEFEIPQAGLTRWDIDSIGRENGFRKDNYYKLSDDAINAYRMNDTIAAIKNIRMLWKNWQLNNKDLQAFNSPSVLIIETPISPEKKEHIIKQEKVDF